MKRSLIGTLALLLAAQSVPAAQPAPASAPAAATTSAPPLVMFIGDSLSAGRNGNHPDPKKFPSWGYTDAMNVLAGKSGDFRFDKRAAGGNSICGQYTGMFRFFKNVTGGGKEAAPEGLKYIVFQDSALDHQPPPEEYEAALRQCVEMVEKKGGVKLILCTTAFEGRKEGDALQEAWNKVNVVMRKVAAEKNLGIIAQDISWPRYVAWYKAKKLPLSEEKNWRLTGKIPDSVHPDLVGSVFMAMTIARELGIAKEKLDVANPDLPVSAAVATEVRDFVYSWTEPTVVPLGGTAPAQ